MLGVMAKMVHRPAEAARAAKEQSGNTEQLRNSSETPGEAQESPGETTERMCCRARVRAEMLYESPWR